MQSTQYKTQILLSSLDVASPAYTFFIEDAAHAKYSLFKRFHQLFPFNKKKEYYKNEIQNRIKRHYNKERDALRIKREILNYNNFFR